MIASLPRYHEQFLGGEHGGRLCDRRVAGELDILRVRRAEGPLHLAPVADLVLAEARSRCTIADAAIGGARNALSPGDLLLTPPGRPTQAVIDRPSDWRVLAIPSVRLPVRDSAGDPEILSRLHGSPFRSAWIGALIERLWNEAQPGNAAAGAYGESALVLILAELGHHAARPPQAATGGLAPWQIKRVTDHMRAQIGRRISLGEIAALVGLSVFHFCRAFKTSTGLAPQQWLQNERVTIACSLLSNTGQSVGEIARTLGYESQSHFSTIFRRAVGECPSRFRTTGRAGASCVDRRPDREIQAG